MRICSPHCGVDPETTSGGETYEREVLRHLGRQGHVIDLVLARHKRLPDDVTNWVVHRLPIARGLRWPVAMALLPPIIRRLHRATGFDLLRAHSLRFIGPAALIARRRYRLDVPIVAHHHHLDTNWLNPLIEARVMRAADRVVIGSEFARVQAGRELGVAPEKFSVVYYGVDERLQRREPSEELRNRLGIRGKAVGLFLGGLKRRKNLFFLLDVWRAVARERDDAVLVIAGSGPLRDALVRRVRALGLDGRVVFAGYVPEREKADYFSLADALIFPSFMEGFGLSVAEAMSCEVPVVASNRGSLPEVLTAGEGGFLGDPGDVDDFARKTLHLLSDPMLRRKFGAANRERVDRLFRWEHCARATARVYQEVLDDWRRTRAPAR
jgi:glycosyltransferase involved in cell wall biosynthesis